jgi:3-phosphoshikimate 1-carboxyvinyltransferase
MFASLAPGQSTIDGFLVSEDCLHTLKALEALGVGIQHDGTSIRIDGVGGQFHSPSAAMDLGNSGTGMRLLAGLLAGQPFTSEMTGDASLRSRPMERIRKPLVDMGAQVELLGQDGRAPIRISGGALHGINYAMPMASAQVKSCVLLAGLFAEGETSVSEPKPTRDHTERLMRAMGIECHSSDARVRLTPPTPGNAFAQSPDHWSVPGDFSAAAFWLTAAAGLPGSMIELNNVGMNARRTALLDVLQRMGGDIEVLIDETDCDWEPRGTVRVRGTEMVGTEISGDEIPNLIDELPLIAVAGALAEGRTHIRDADELRLKESDRISAVANGLRTLGVKVEELPDGMIVEGDSKIQGGVSIDSCGDHRIAMSMAILSLWADAPNEIRNVECVNTSYPEFWNHLEAICR